MVGLSIIIIINFSLFLYILDRNNFGGTDTSLPRRFIKLWNVNCLDVEIDISHPLGFVSNNPTTSITELAGEMYSVIRSTNSEVVLTNVNKAVEAIMKYRFNSPEFIDERAEIKAGMRKSGFIIEKHRPFSCTF